MKILKKKQNKMGTLFVHELVREIAYKWIEKIVNQKVIQIETKMPRPSNKYYSSFSTMNTSWALKMLLSTAITNREEHTNRLEKCWNDDDFERWKNPVTKMVTQFSIEWDKWKEKEIKNSYFRSISDSDKYVEGMKFNFFLYLKLFYY